MDFLNTEATTQPRLVSLKVRNFRVLRSVEFKNLTPLTVLLGPNGSGKSTVLEVLDFLWDCFQLDLRRACLRHGSISDNRTKGESGPVAIEIKYREVPGQPLMTYHLALDEAQGRPFVRSEWLQWRPKGSGKIFRALDNQAGKVRLAHGEINQVGFTGEEIVLRQRSLLAADVLGQFDRHPQIATLRSFIAGWHISHLSVYAGRRQSDEGGNEQLSTSGHNLANVIQFLNDTDNDRLESIFEVLRRGVPQIDRAMTDITADGRLFLQIKDFSFDDPIAARFASDGTRKMLAYLVLLYAPEPPPFIGLEEPENFLHHRLLYELAETFRVATAHTQLLATTHSPFFLDALRPEEVRVLWRDKQGYTQTRRAADLLGVPEFIAEGALLGQLWSEGHFRVGDPLYHREAEPGDPRWGR